MRWGRWSGEGWGRGVGARSDPVVGSGALRAGLPLRGVPGAGRTAGLRHGVSQGEGSRRGGSGRKRGDVGLAQGDPGARVGSGRSQAAGGAAGILKRVRGSRAGRPLGARRPVGGVRGAGILGRGRHGVALGAGLAPHHAAARRSLPRDTCGRPARSPALGPSPRPMVGARVSEAGAPARAGGPGRAGTASRGAPPPGGNSPWVLPERHVRRGTSFWGREPSPSTKGVSDQHV